MWVGGATAERAWVASAMTEIEYQPRFIRELTERSPRPETERRIPFVETVERIPTMRSDRARLALQGGVEAVETAIDSLGIRQSARAIFARDWISRARFALKHRFLGSCSPPVQKLVHAHRWRLQSVLQDKSAYEDGIHSQC